jgi:hypothetical protein
MSVMAWLVAVWTLAGSCALTVATALWTRPWWHPFLLARRELRRSRER